MSTIGAFEAKTHFSSLLEQVERGEEVTITKHGRPVARLVPLSGQSRIQLKEIIEAIKSLRAGRRLGDISWKGLRDEGRK